MGENNPSKRLMKRRTVLQALGSTTALSTTGIHRASAKSGPSYKEILEQSHRILEKRGVDQQHDFLQNHGIGTVKETTTKTVSQANKGISTQALTKSQISLSFSLFNDCNQESMNEYPNGTYVAELSWEYDYPIGFGGERPLDFVGIGWDGNTWYYENNSTNDSYSNWGDFIQYYGRSSGQGPAWSVKDWNLAHPLAEETDTCWVGVNLNWLSSEEEKDKPTIAASYTHTWEDLEITGVDVSYPAGVSVSARNKEDEWDKDTDGDKYLELGYKDIEGCS